MGAGRLARNGLFPRGFLGAGVNDSMMGNIAVYTTAWIAVDTRGI
jgi:hypothetical protein